MSKNKRQRKIHLYLLIVLGLTIGFALLSTTLYINGTAGVKANTWDIHFENVEVNSESTITAEEPQISNDKKTVSYEVELELPGDYFEFTVDAVNTGSIAGAIDDIKHTVYAGNGIDEDELPNYIKYSIVYDGTTTTPKKGDILAPNDSKTYRIRIEYDSEATTLPNQNKSYVIKEEFIYKQIKYDGCATEYNVGDRVHFNPVNYEFCTLNSDNCYSWIVLSKTGSKYELFYDEPNSSMLWTQQNPVDVIKSYTTNWSNKLTVDSSYDIPVTETYGYNFSETKARTLTLNDLNSSETFKNKIKPLCHSSAQCLVLDTTDNIMRQYIAGIITTTFGFSVNANGGATLGNAQIRPIISVDTQDTGGINTCIKKVKYNVGDLVYYDPVSQEKCNSESFDLDAIINGTSTCYKWRVITVDDTKNKEKINLQLDHSFTNDTAWAATNEFEDTHRYCTRGPITALKALSQQTRGWQRLELLNYEYDTNAALTNYGTLKCVNGTCYVDEAYDCSQGPNYCMVTKGYEETAGLRARLITGEEFVAIVNKDKYLSPEAKSKYWTLAADNLDDYYFYFSQESVKVGESLVHDGETFPTSSSWLIENTHLYWSEESPYTTYATENVYGPHVPGYWTLSPHGNSGAWFVSGSYGSFTTANINISYMGIRPVINIEKSKITK